MKNKAEEFHQKVMEEIKTYSTEKVDKYFFPLEGSSGRDADYYREIYRKTDYPCWFYWYLACATRVLKAKQVVELGADKGASALMMASEGARVYSVDIRKDGWEYVPPDFDKIIKLVGNTLDFALWENISLENTDLWLIDAEHSPDRVRKECEAYRPFWKKGAVVIFDDLNFIGEAWEELPYDKKDLGTDIHGNGVGLVVI